MSSPVASPPRPVYGDTRTRAARVAPWFPLVLAVGVAAATLLFLLLEPSQAAALQQPVVSDGDQSRLSPQPEPGLVTILWGFSALPLIVLGPLVAMWVAAWAGTWAWLSWERLRSRDQAFLILAAVIAVGVVAVDFSSVGQAVARRSLD